MIDTHLHIWNPALIDYGWLNEAPALLNRCYEPNDIVDEARAAGVTSAVLVQAANSVDETAYLIQQAQMNDWICGVVGWVNLMLPENLQGMLATLDTNCLKGVRHLSHIEPDEAWLLQANVLDSLAILEQNGLTLDVVGTTMAHLDCAITIVRNFPSLKMVIDHLNQPPADTGKATEWKERMMVLSRHSNVLVKVSGMGTALNKGKNWTAGDILPWFAFCLQHFGQHRILLGSDWPVCLLAGSYGQTMANYKQMLELYPSTIQQNIKRNNAIHAYQLQSVAL